MATPAAVKKIVPLTPLLFGLIVIAILIGARTHERCPISGTWKLIGDASVTIQLDKGNIMPAHNNNAPSWQL